jgi:hypothetical protein
LQQLTRKLGIALLILVAFCHSEPCSGEATLTLIDVDWQSFDVGTALTTIPGWSEMGGSANTPVVAISPSEPTNKFLTTGTENNQASRDAFTFVNPGFKSSTKLTFTVDLYDPLVNSQSSLSTFPRAVLGMFELGGDISMPSYFGMEQDDNSSNDTTAEWVVAGENFGEPATAPRMFSPEGSIAQDTWYTVQSVWDFQSGTKSLLVKPRNSTGPFTPIFDNVPIGFLNPSQNPADLNAIGVRLNRGTRVDNLRVEYTPVAPPGEYNSDLTVNAADYVLWRKTLGSTTDLRADGDGNGRVDAADYDFWRARFGNTNLPQQLANYAVASAPVVGGPARSDVMFSVRSFFSSPSQYASVASAFHATRDDWTYSVSSAGVTALKNLGMTTGGAMNASIHSLPVNSPGIAISWQGIPYTHSSDGDYWGDVNSPVYRQSALDVAKSYINAGAKRIQWDDPRMNTQIVADVGGSFTPDSVAKYTDWLAANSTAAQRTAAGLPANLSGFSYLTYVQSHNGVVSGAATSLWMTFNYQATIDFFSWFKQSISDYAGFQVPFSDNNLGFWDLNSRVDGDHQEFIGIYRWFDYGIAELYPPDQNPQFIFQSVHRAQELGKQQAFTLVSTNVQLNRKVMAYTYAVGGNMVMPWDVYVPNSPRFFGNPNDYNDITTFVRQHAQLLDGHETAAFVGPGLTDDKTGAFEPLQIDGGSGQVFAFARAVPGDTNAPIVIHLVDWDDTPDPFTLRLRNEMFGWPMTEPMTAQFLRPGMADSILTGVVLADGYTAFSLPALSPYALMVINHYVTSAESSRVSAVPEPSSSAVVAIILAYALLQNRSSRKYRQ